MTAATFPLDAGTRQSSVLVGDGATTTFGPFSFKIFSVDDVEIWRKDLGDDRFTLRTGPTIAKTSPAEWENFTLSFAGPPPATSSFFVRGARQQSRSLAVRKANQLDTDAIDKELTKIGAVQLEQSRDLDRTVSVDRNITAPVVVENLADGNLLVAGQDGAIKNGPAFSDLEDMKDDADDARDAAIAAKNAAQSAAATAAGNAVSAAGTLLSGYVSSALSSKDAAASSAVNASASVAASAGAASAASVSAAAAEAARIAAAAAAEATGDVKFFDTKAAADSGLSGLPNGTVVEVFADEDHSDQRTRYMKTGGVYVFKLVMPNTALDIGIASTAGNGVDRLAAIDDNGNLVLAVAQTLPSFPTIAAAAALRLGALTEIQIMKWSSGSRQYPARYAKVGSVPSHACYFMAADGTIWELLEQNPHVFMVGAIGDATTDDKAAIQRAIDYLRIRWGGGNVRGEGAVCGVGSTVTINGSGIVLCGAKGNPMYLRRKADNGPLLKIGTGTATVIGRCGFKDVQFQDLTNIGHWANSPYGVIFENVTDIVQDRYELYCESMKWAGVYSTKIGNGKIYYAGGEKAYEAGRNAWLVTSHNIGSGFQSTEIWPWGHVDIQCGKLSSGGTVINSYCTTGLKIEACDGFEASGIHVQGPLDAEITIQSFASSGFDTTNITLRSPFCDLCNGHGIKIQGDQTIYGLVITDLIVSHKGFNSTAERFGVLVTTNATGTIHIARGDGTMGDLVRLDDVDIDGLHLKIDVAENIGCKADNTYDVVAINHAKNVAVFIGAFDGNSQQTRSAGFFGSGADHCSFHGGRVTGFNDAFIWNDDADSCSISSIVLQGNTNAATNYSAAVNAKIRGCVGVADF